jgi:hypothetical protein
LRLCVKAFGPLDSNVVDILTFEHPLLNTPFSQPSASRARSAHSS